MRLRFAAAELGILVTADDLPLLGVSAPKDLVDSNDDIEGEHPKPSERRLSFGPGKPWKGGHVPFCFDQSMHIVPHETQRRVIEGMRVWQKAVGCLSFQQVWGSYHDDGTVRCHVQPSIFITSNTNGHWSDVGSKKGNVKMNLDVSDAAFTNPGLRAVSIGIIIHELGHALGMVHEHQRKDRDRYVEVLKDNFDFDAFKKDWKPNFAINPKADTQRPYDVLSIMHYSSGAGGEWSRNSQPLLRARKKACWTYGVRGDDHGEECKNIRNSMGQRMGITQLDADQVADLYR